MNSKERHFSTETNFERTTDEFRKKKSEVTKFKFKMITVKFSIGMLDKQNKNGLAKFPIVGFNFQIKIKKKMSPKVILYL
jgi:hypothetical protein